MLKEKNTFFIVIFTTMIHIKIVYKQNIKKRDNIIVCCMLLFADTRPPPLPVDIFHFRNKTQTPEEGLQTILTSRRIFIKQKKKKSQRPHVFTLVCVCAGKMRARLRRRRRTARRRWVEGPSWRRRRRRRRQHRPLLRQRTTSSLSSCCA